MKNKLSILSILFAALLSTAAFADVVVTPNKDPRSLFKWTMGPSLVKGSQSCGTANICVGSYEETIPGFHGSVVVGGGYAYCNSVSGSCPSARDCVADNRMSVNQSPSVFGDAYRSQSSGSNSTNRGQ